MPAKSRAAPWVKAPMVPDALGYVWVAGRGVFQRVNIVRKGSRNPDPTDILLPEGFAAEVVATDFNEPVHATFGHDGACYVTEAGYRIDSPPRILKVDTSSGEREVVFEIPGERWNQSGALTGCAWHDGYLYYSYNDHIGRFRPGEPVEEIVTDLPGRGDHQLSPPTFGPDGKLYFSTGSATNCGVVGADNIAYEWLRNPALQDVCDSPGADVVLTGRNYESQDVTGKLRDKVRTGAFVPFGTQTEAGQIIAGQTKCTTGVLRCDPDGSNLELLAWGLRNAFGLQHHPDGRLFATEHGIDERSPRFIVGDPDDFYEVTPGDLVRLPRLRLRAAAGRPALGRRRSRPGAGRRRTTRDAARALRVLHRPRGSQRVRLCGGRPVRFPGDAFVACFGDAAPVTTRRIVPAGFKVVRIDMAQRKVVYFAVNRIAGGASILPHNGFERPVDCRFGPDGSLYVVDWAEMVPAPERGGVEIRLGTGLVWRIRRTGADHGDLPPKPLVLPVNLLRAVVPAAGVVAAAAVVRATRRSRPPRPTSPFCETRRPSCAT
ncbi:MAG TPA: hypothetical protein VM388_12835 [Acidimicrobiales bacterium]|nr:hypothetical protein [Acidimicrobiales bacterium]